MPAKRSAKKSRSPKTKNRDASVSAVSISTAGKLSASMKRLVRASEIVSRAEIMLTHLKEGQSEVSILLCDDPTIHSLNRDYRKKDKPTDVLAFAMREGKFAKHAGNMLGDVIISLDTAARQAEDRNIGLLDEVTMLLAHGLLHLLGWDHQTDKEERAMTKKTNQLVALF